VEIAMNAKHVLLVNGDKETRYIYRLVLEKDGLFVSEAADSPAALLIVSLNCPDLVIQELKLVPTDGLDLIRSLRAMDSARHLRILVITSHALDGEAAEHAGCDVFLTKPCRPSRMAEEARRLLA
jgi:two-component system, cell cycle response regulator DivK